MINIGDVYWAKYPYYDKIKHVDSFKYRPVLIIGKADKSDYNILPIATCKKVKYKDEYYDVPIGLKEPSYIRTHKQSIVNANSLDDFVVNLKSNYKKEYDIAIERLKHFNENLENNL